MPQVPCLIRPARPSLALALVLALVAAPGAAEDLVTAGDPGKILEIARGFGSAELETGAEGAPMIRGRMNGKRYSIFFNDCTDGADCGTIQFWTYMAAPPDALAAVNDWNRDYRFAEAYLDRDGDVSIEMDVNLWGGVSPRNLDDTFDWWRLVLEQARRSFRDPGPPPPDTGALGKTL
jgi:hypothetical protein